MVGIYRTDVEDWHMEWYGDGIVWKGNRNKVHCICSGYFVYIHMMS